MNNSVSVSTVCIYMYVCMYMHVRMYVCDYKSMYICVYAYMYVCMTLYILNYLRISQGGCHRLLMGPGGGAKGVMY